MSHQPFEGWLLDDEALSGEQNRALEAHLGDCPACAKLKLSLTAVERSLTQAAAVSPEPGFGLRFARRLEQHRLRSGRRQAWGAFSLAALAAAALGLPALLRLGDDWDTPGRLVMQMLIRLYDAWVALKVAGGFVRVLWSNLPGVVPPAWALGFMLLCLGVILAWVALFYRFAFRRVTEGV